jgi:hypothetical protein
MKKLSAYLLLLVLLVISVSACSKTEDPSSVAADTPYPLQVIANAGDGRVTLDWQMDKSAATYNIYWIEDPTGSTYSVTNLPTSATMKGGHPITGRISATYTVTGLNNNTKYWFALSLVNSTGESVLTSAIYAVPKSSPPPAAPENVRANAGKDASENARVTVTWDHVAGADHYFLYCYWREGLNVGIGTIDSITTNLQIVDLNTINWIAGEDAGIKFGRTYSFTIYAVNGDGIFSSSSFAAYATPSVNPPPMAPVLTNASTGSSPSDQIELDWNPPTAYTGTIKRYTIYYGPVKGETKDNQAFIETTSDGTYTSANVSSLVSGTKYYFVVTATDDNGESAESNEESAIAH